MWVCLHCQLGSNTSLCGRDYSAANPMADLARMLHLFGMQHSFRFLSLTLCVAVRGDQQVGAAGVCGHLRHLPVQDPDPRAGEGRPHQVLVAPGVSVRREPSRSIAGARICSLAPTRKMPHRKQSLHAFACQLHLDWHSPVTAKFILLCHKIVLLPPVASSPVRPLQALMEADSIHLSKRPLIRSNAPIAGQHWRC